MNNPDSLACDLSSKKQFGFMATLPSDIIPEIFAHLDQRDCLMCMSVCRAWYLSIPQYAQTIWRTLWLSKKDIDTENQCLIHCLGEHVKYVTLDKLGNEKDVYDTIYKLLDWGCTKVESLELNECQTEDQDALLAALTKLAPCLTHLKMLSHGSNIAFLHVLNACPRLTHFTYQSKIGYSNDIAVIDKEPTVLNPLLSIDAFPNITHLSMDAMLDTQKLLNPILQRCPNLRSFTGTSFATADIQNSETFPRYVVNYDMLFDWCPKLTCITGSLSYVYLKDLTDPSIINDRNEFTGLRNFRVADIYQQDGIIRRLSESQDTLETLSVNPILAYETPSWPTILTSLQLTKLKNFEFRRIQFDASSIVDILNRCPALERLSLESTRLVLDPGTVGLLEPMHHLRYLNWSHISFADGLSLVTLLERFPALESLVLRYLTAPPTFPDSCGYLRQLHDLCLRDIRWTADSSDTDRKEAPIRLLGWFAAHSEVNEIVLSDIESFSARALPTVGMIPTLTVLEVDLDDQCGGTEKADLYRFSTSLSRTTIEEIYIETWGHLPIPTVNKLKELPYLRDLRVYHRWEESYCSQCSRRHDASSL